MRKFFASTFAVLLFCGIFASSIGQAEILPTTISRKGDPLENYRAKLEESIVVVVQSWQKAQNKEAYMFASDSETVVTPNSIHWRRTTVAGKITCEGETDIENITRFREAGFCMVYAVYFILLPAETAQDKEIHKLFDDTIEDIINTTEMILRRESRATNYKQVWSAADIELNRIQENFKERLGKEAVDKIANALISIDLSDRTFQTAVYIIASEFANAFSPSKDFHIKLFSTFESL
jgi:hypothetical protein